jgi:hypothetical protein
MNILWIAYAGIVRNSPNAAPAELCPLPRTRGPQLVHADRATQAVARNGKSDLSPAFGQLY